MNNEYDDMEVDTFIVLDEYSGRIMGVYSELVDAMDRIEELKIEKIEAVVEAYIMDSDVDYDEDETDSDTFAFESK